MRVQTVEGVVIRRRNSGEADRILTVFTKQQGKMQVKAIGVRKIASRRSAHTELLTHAQFSLYAGKNMPILTEVQTIESFGNLKEDLSSIGLAYHICELIDGLCADHQEHRDVFDLLVKTLRRLSEEADTASLINRFEVTLLSQLGFYQSSTKPITDTTAFIEHILEKRLKTRRLLHTFQDK